MQNIKQFVHLKKNLIHEFRWNYQAKFFTDLPKKTLNYSYIVPEFKDKFSSHNELYKYSISNINEFWGTLAESRIQWIKPFDKVNCCDITKGYISWFSNGKLNVSVNCVDRHYSKTPDKIALIWEKDEPNTHEFIKYRELYKMMNQIANSLKSEGVKKGDPVIIYLPNSPVAVASMLACARIGAIHSLVFAGFSSQSLATRINDSSCETIITADKMTRGGKEIELKKIVDAAINNCPNVKRVFVNSYSSNKPPLRKLDILLQDNMAKQSSECEPEPMDSDDILFLLYTSGSTGKPKGIAHAQAGYLLFSGFTHQAIFDCKDDDIFACVADIGWITGHSYGVYGPLFNGNTSLLFESTPIYPNPGRYWEMVERLRLTHFYCAPTALRMLLQHSDTNVTSYDRSSLKLLASVGEPINHEAWQWYHDVVGEGRSPVVDTWWQTETGGVCITPRPSGFDDEILPGMPMRPIYGIEPVLLDEKNRVLKDPDAYGALCLKSVWPGMAKTIYGDQQRFFETYFKPSPGYFTTGDGAHKIDGKYFRITGRIDDVINVSGHRIGTAELEDVLDEHEIVAETAVVPFPHNIKGEGIYAFIVLKDDLKNFTVQQLKDELKSSVKNHIAAYAMPDQILFCTSLPKTRSGKIMRRILRKIASENFDDLGDVTTLADPAVVEEIINLHIKVKNNVII